MSKLSQKLVSTPIKKIGIIVPVYNVEKYLATCLESIRNQTYKHWICLVVDDGSTDNSSAIIRQFCEKDKRFIGFFQKNSGIGETRNKALEYLFENDFGVEFIAFVDSDDITEPNMYEELVNSIEKDNSDIALSSFSEFNEKNSNLITRQKKSFKENRSYVISREDFLNIVFSMGNLNGNIANGGYVWRILFRINLLKDVRFTNDREVCEDELFDLKISKNIKKVSVIPLPLYKYRQRANSTVRNKKFQEQHIRGRSLCVEYSKQISKTVYFLTIGALFKVYLQNFKNTGQKIKSTGISNEDLETSYKSGYIPLKDLLLYRFITRNSFFSFTYLKLRELVIYFRDIKRRFVSKPTRQI